MLRSSWVIIEPQSLRLFAVVGMPREQCGGAVELLAKHHLRERVLAGKCSVLLATHALDIVERYADRAALLLNGRIAHEWRKEELAAMREKSEEGFEAALAAAAVEAEGK